MCLCACVWLGDESSCKEHKSTAVTHVMHSAAGAASSPAAAHESLITHTSRSDTVLPHASRICRLPVMALLTQRCRHHNRFFAYHSTASLHQGISQTWIAFARLQRPKCWKTHAGINRCERRSFPARRDRDSVRKCCRTAVALRVPQPSSVWQRRPPRFLHTLAAQPAVTGGLHWPVAQKRGCLRHLCSLQLMP